MRILIAEDEAVSRKMLERALARMGHEVVSCENGREAWHELRSGRIRLVIADWEMPEMDGLELVRRIRASEGAGDASASGSSDYVYLILLTSRVKKQDKVLGLDAGADDYITKPFDQDELMVRIRAGERIIQLQEELAERNAQLRELALVDGLTGVANRRSFDSAYRKLQYHCRRFSRPFGMLMVDIDRFKRYNDAAGHEAGDEALRCVAQTILETVRTSDTVYRYGGEEFAVLLPETKIEGAQAVAERVRALIEDAGFPHPDNPPAGNITVSIGFAAFDPQDIHSDPSKVVRHADEALYLAKERGRNRVEGPVHPSEVSP